MQKIKKKRKVNWHGWTMFGIGLIGGIVLGMMMQQLIIKQAMIEIGYSFSGAIENVEIDLNETKLIEDMKELFIPVFNQTFSNIDYMSNFSNCTPVPCECHEWGCALYCMYCEE